MLIILPPAYVYVHFGQVPQVEHAMTAGAIAGSVAATAAIFLPAFVFIAALGKVLPRIGASPAARGAVDAAGAAVVALMFVVTVDLAWSALPDPLSLALAAAAVAALVQGRINATWVMLAAGVLGMTRAVRFPPGCPGTIPPNPAPGTASPPR